MDRILAVVNPRTLAGGRAAAWRMVLDMLRQRHGVDCLETAGDGTDRERITVAIANTCPALVLAAGGDGTLRVVVSAVLASTLRSAPAVGVAPLGTGNNVARGLGVHSLAHGGSAASAVVGTLTAGRERRLDIGRANDEVFVGSFAAGMDGAILALRNRWRPRHRFAAALGGYPLYLVSCAANLARQRPAAARLMVDGTVVERRLYNAVVTNTPLYAGEFRFDVGDQSTDGALDLHLFGDATEYVREYVRAWRRHVHETRGERVRAWSGLRRITALDLQSERPLPAQVDGEELPPATRFAVRIAPQALRFRVPHSAQPADAVSHGVRSRESAR